MSDIWAIRELSTTGPLHLNSFDFLYIRGNQYWVYQKQEQARIAVTAGTLPQAIPTITLVETWYFINPFFLLLYPPQTITNFYPAFYAAIIFGSSTHSLSTAQQHWHPSHRPCCYSQHLELSWIQGCAGVYKAKTTELDDLSLLSSSSQPKRQEGGGVFKWVLPFTPQRCQRKLLPATGKWTSSYFKPYRKQI